LALKYSVIQISGDPAVEGLVPNTLSKTSAMATRTLSGGEMGCFAGNREGRLLCYGASWKESPSQSLMNWTSDLVCLVDHGETVKFLEIIFDIMNAVACRSCSEELVPGLVETHFGRRSGASDLADKVPGKMYSFVWRCRNIHKPGDPMLDPDCATGKISRKRTPYEQHAGDVNVRAEHQLVDHRGGYGLEIGSELEALDVEGLAPAQLLKDECVVSTRQRARNVYPAFFEG